MSDRPISLVILYMHPLLGQGLARFLSAEPGLEITTASGHEAGDARGALDGNPEIVIVERGVPIELADLLRAARETLVIDVGMDTGPSWRLEREEMSARPDELLQAIRRFSRLERAHPAGRLTPVR